MFKVQFDDQRVAQEIDVLAMLPRHPCVVEFVGACTQPPNICILTEFVSRGSLAKWLGQRAVQWMHKLQIAHDVARGMCFLHENDIVHRDLNCMNVLLDDEWRAKVCDFGVARIKSRNVKMTSNVGTCLSLCVCVYVCVYHQLHRASSCGTSRSFIC